jgi:2-polyprenyl-3-methyl-5-hydroxy-6-metoxy-1,4-benzoquinol methylase
MPSRLPCKVCGVRSKYVYSLEQDSAPSLEVYLCPGCGLLFVGNTPSEEQLAAMYSQPQEKDYYTEIATETHGKNLKAADDVVSLLAEIPDPFVCDLGCGDGHFLELMREVNPGLKLCGAEISKPRAAVARSKGFQIIEHAIGKEKDRFSLITMLDVAEHVADPIGVFAECRNSLLPGGRIYIHTPCRCFWDSLSLWLIRFPGLRKLGMKWLKTRVSSAHLHLWTAKALNLAFEKAGFRMSRLTRELELSWPLENYIAVYLRKNPKMPEFVINTTEFLADLIFIRLRALKNKAICVGERCSRVQTASS